MSATRRALGLIRTLTSVSVVGTTPDYTTVDLTAHAKLARHVTLQAGVFNLFDEKYWLWSDMRSLLNPGVTADRYTQPGRNFAAQVKLDF